MKIIVLIRIIATKYCIVFKIKLFEPSFKPFFQCYLLQYKIYLSSNPDTENNLK